LFISLNNNLTALKKEAAEIGTTNQQVEIEQVLLEVFQ
jgi:hypothetical protein